MGGGSGRPRSTTRVCAGREGPRVPSGSSRRRGPLESPVPSTRRVVRKMKGPSVPPQEIISTRWFRAVYRWGAGPLEREDGAGVDGLREGWSWCPAPEVFWSGERRVRSRRPPYDHLPPLWGGSSRTHTLLRQQSRPHLVLPLSVSGEYRRTVETSCRLWVNVPPTRSRVLDGDTGSRE